MVILGLDTTTREGSAALVDGDTTRVVQGDPDRTHGERLPGELVQLVRNAGRALADVERLAVCAGPGSFTGLRVGLATIQGLALSLGRPVVTVPTLEAIARAWRLDAGADGTTVDRVVPWMNAHRGEVFAAVYAVGRTDLEADAGGALVGQPSDLVDLLAPQLSDRTVVFVGDAVDATRDMLTARGWRTVDSTRPLAGVIAELARSATGDALRSPHAVQPVYVRRPDAVLARERRTAAARPS